MKLLIMNAHWYNRGDEAALRAMIDELVVNYPDAQIKVHMLSTGEYFPYEGQVSLTQGVCPAGGRIKWVDFWLRYLTKGKIGFRPETKKFYDEILEADLILHGPGGPAIGDIYLDREFEYLARYLLVRRAKKKYAFYAPSMGPFNSKKHMLFRKKILNGASMISVREPISKKYLEEFGIKNEIYVTLDSAFQHPIDADYYAKQFDQNQELINFIGKYPKIVGCTITDLMWNPKYTGNTAIAENIKETFTKVVGELTRRGYGIVFIPQLFGKGDDAKYMAGFANENCYILPVNQQNDCYFQQYVISRMYAVIGMRYHSNIFAAKMGTPFVSVSYEQKMKGFMNKAGLGRYCIDLRDLSSEQVLNTLELLVSEYDSYKEMLKNHRMKWQKEAHETTNLVIKLIENRK